MNIEIRRTDGSLLYSGEHRSIKEALASMPNRKNLSEADLRRANLSRANLSRAETAPVVPRIDAAILARIESGGVLDMKEWHICETTHCRAGWAVTLAGEAGKELEDKIGTNAAAALIYTASRQGERVPDWFASNEDALADIRLHAAKQ
jgi:Pentapeptide repeats (8 copies)